MNKNETLENTRKRLKFRSWHRGTREMDLLLGSFADRYVPDFDENALKAYEAVLMHNDPDLYSWMTGKESPPANVEACAVFKLLRAHKFTGD